MTCQSWLTVWPSPNGKWRPETGQSRSLVHLSTRYALYCVGGEHGNARGQALLPYDILNAVSCLATTNKAGESSQRYETPSSLLYEGIWGDAKLFPAV